jgi:hypothetical protein
MYKERLRYKRRKEKMFGWGYICEAEIVRECNREFDAGTAIAFDL